MFYDKIPQLTYFDENDLLEVEELCAGLSEQEVLDYYAIDMADLEAESLETPDLKYFNMAFRRGRTRYKNMAIRKLFSSMGEKNGAQASLSYLRHFGAEWPATDADADKSSGKFSFNVTMNE